MNKLQDSSIIKRLPEVNLKNLITLNLNDDDNIHVINVDNDLDVIVIHGSEVEVDKLPYPYPHVARDKTRVYVDIRPHCYKKNTKRYPEVVKNKSDAEMLITAGLLAGLVENGSIEEWNYMYKPSFNVLSRAIADGILNSFHVVPTDVPLIQATVDYYCNAILARDGSRIESISFTNFSNVPNFDIDTVIEQVAGEGMNTIERLAEIMVEVVPDSNSIQRLKSPHIYAHTIRQLRNVMDSNFAGIAMEYPPFWIAFMYTAYNAQGLKYKSLNKTFSFIDNKLSLMSRQIDLLWNGRQSLI